MYHIGEPPNRRYLLTAGGTNTQVVAFVDVQNQYQVPSTSEQTSLAIHTIAVVFMRLKPFAAFN